MSFRVSIEADTRSRLTRRNANGTLNLGPNLIGVRNPPRAVGQHATQRGSCVRFERILTSTWPNSQPAPGPSAIGQILLAKSFAGVRFFHGNDDGIHHEHWDGQQDEGPKAAENDGNPSIDQADSEIHRVATEAIRSEGDEPRRTRRVNDRGRSMRNRMAFAGPRRTPITSRTHPSPPIECIQTGRHGNRRSAPMPTRKTARKRSGGGMTASRDLRPSAMAC